LISRQKLQIVAALLVGLAIGIGVMIPLNVSVKLALPPAASSAGAN